MSESGVVIPGFEFDSEVLQGIASLDFTLLTLSEGFRLISEGGILANVLQAEAAEIIEAANVPIMFSAPGTAVRVIADLRGASESLVFQTGIVADTIFAGQANDLVDTGAGQDEIMGGGGDDLLFGGEQSDEIFGNSGNDFIHADAIFTDGNLVAGTTLNGPFSIIEITGGLVSSGQDFVDGGSGNDTIFGGNLSDTLIGGTGDDILNPGARGFMDNEDFLVGGAGADIFQLTGGDPSTVPGDVAEFFIGSTTGEIVDVVSEAINEAVEQAALDSTVGIFDSITDTGASVLAASVAGPLGGALSAILDLIVDVIINSTPSSEDTIRIFDFNPTEDQIFVPLGTDDTADLSVRVGSASRQDPFGGPAEERTAIIVERLNPDDGQTALFAVIHPSDAFLASVGITDPNAPAVQTILENVVGNSINFNRQGVLSEDGEMLAAFDTELEGPQAIVQVIGAIDSLISNAQTNEGPGIVVGTRFGDIISASEEFVIPGTENISVDALGNQTDIFGFAGDDVIFGSRGSDRLFGGDGLDEIYSFGGDVNVIEEINAGSGDDTVNAGVDRNNLIALGGDGIDIFSFEFSENEIDLTFGLIDPFLGVDGFDEQTFGFFGFGIDPDFDPFQGSVENDASGSFSLIEFETIIGSDQDDRFDLLQANNFDFVSAGSPLTIFGGAGSDTFTPTLNNGGSVIIGDFDATEDRIDVSSLGISSFGQVSVNTTANGITFVTAMSQNLSDFGAVFNILLDGDINGTLTADNFEFFDGAFVVTTRQDIVDDSDGLTSLREAIMLANLTPGEQAEITFSDNLLNEIITIQDADGNIFQDVLRVDQQTITLQLGEIEITSGLSINGDIDGDGTADIIIDGNNQDRIFNINGAATGDNDSVTLESLVLTGGNTTGSGGAILNGFTSEFDLFIAGSTITNNTAADNGGGIFDTNEDDRALSIINSTINNNSAGEDGGGLNIFAVSPGSVRATLSNVTIANNVAGDEGGGIFANRTFIASSTITGNQVLQGGFAGAGIFAFGDSPNLANVAIENSIVLGNATVVNGSLSTFNETNNNVLDFIGGPNIIGGFAPSDIFENIDPLTLGGLLADNGGPVQTVALLTDNANPALDRVIGGSNFTPDTDARGEAIFDVFEAGTSVTLRDLGAFEAQNITSGALSGTPFDDDIIGTDDANTITALDGNDTVAAGAGNDLVLGGVGDDSLLGNEGNDLLNGGIGADNLIGNTGNDSLDGGDGDDTLAGNQGIDTLNGGQGNDILTGGGDADFLTGEAGNDQIFGGTGNDTIIASTGNDLVVGDDGDDTLIGNAGFDTLEGGAGDDFLDGRFNADILSGDVGNDTLLGGAGGDTLKGGVSFDSLFGGDGDDILNGGSNADNLFGEAGNDTLNGDQGLDRLFGGDGADDLAGGFGNDVLFGEFGNDHLNGEAGNDRILAGAGFDTLNGGTGDDTLTGNFNADLFVFEDGFGNDTITDFDQANNFERIDLSAVTDITDFTDLINNHLSEIGGNAVITDGVNTITINGVSIAQLVSGDFIF